jgi:hypothetical protein
VNIYEHSQAFGGEPDKAIEFAASTLAAMGYRLDERAGSMLVASLPMLLNDSKNPLQGVGRIEIRADRGSISTRADLNKLSRLYKGLGFSLVGLGILLSVVMVVTLPPKIKWEYRLLLAWAPLVPWVVIAPAMYSWSMRRARKAVATLLQNAAVMAR